MDTARQDSALFRIGQELSRRQYRFITPTPLTHARILKRPAQPLAATLEDIFGWNRPFAKAALDAGLFALLSEAGVLSPEQDHYRCRIRFSSVGENLFLHSGYPTEASDSVFFGPDTYRFIHAVEDACRARPKFCPSLICDIGAGSGAGGLVIAARRGTDGAPRVLLTDINPLALRYGAINARLNGIGNATCRASDILAAVPERPDLIIANPPYLVDAAARTYRHGGGRWGTELSLRILCEGLKRLAPGGLLVLYTGAPVVEGVDVFRRDAVPLLERFAAAYRYSEMDPDVFGEELEAAPYDAADRIAAIALAVEAAAQENRDAA